MKSLKKLTNVVPKVFDLRNRLIKKQLTAERISDTLLNKLEREEPVRVTVTGAAGAIGYATLFRICNGEMLGKKQRIHLNLLELPSALNALKGVAMELEDCAFPLLESLTCSDDPHKAFDACEIALMVGSKPRGPGMERSDLLQENGVIFERLGKVMNEVAATYCRVTVVGNPCNTNCLILANNAPDIRIENFTAMTRLDHDRTVSILTRKTTLPSNEINKVAVWGNHSEMMFADITECTVHGIPCMEYIGHNRALRYWENELIPKVRKRGSKIIECRGSSSAASAGSACIAHTRDWCMGTELPDWKSMAFVSNGQFGVPPGLVFSYPTICTDGMYSIANCQNLSDIQQFYIEQNIRQLEEERDLVSKFLPN